MKYDCLILDLDDTLFDYEATEREAIKYACTKQGIPFNAEIVSIYHRASEMAKADVKNYLINLTEFRKVRVKYFYYLINNDHADSSSFIEDYMFRSKQGVLLDGVAITLRQLAGIKIIVATNGSDNLRKYKLLNSEIAGLVTEYYSSESMGVAKPNPEFYRKILSNINIPKQRVLVVGDRYETDILSALELGLQACWFNWKRHKSPVLMKCAMIYSFKELLHIVGV